jgi:hypothetical protein
MENLEYDEPIILALTREIDRRGASATELSQEVIP